MSDCSRDVESMEEHADSTRKEVVRYDGGRPGTGQVGQTRPSGIVAVGDRNKDDRVATFKGTENLRRSKNR